MKTIRDLNDYQRDLAFRFGYHGIFATPTTKDEIDNAIAMYRSGEGYHMLAGAGMLQNRAAIGKASKAIEPTEALELMK